MTKPKKSVLALAVLLVIAAVFIGVWKLAGPDGQAGQKELTIQIVHGDGQTAEFGIATQAETLADALLEHQLVEDTQGAYGLYILTADGETVNEANQEWWCITRDGESLTTGASDTVIADGEQYELTFTVGYDF